MRELQPIVPNFARRGDYVPVVGGYLNVTLPGEIVRSEVMEIHSRDVAVVKILSVVLGKGGHQYHTGDLVAVRRAQTDLAEQWEPISDREVREREERARAARFAREEEERAIREDTERRAAEAGSIEEEIVEPPPTRAAAERPAGARPRKGGGTGKARR